MKEPPSILVQARRQGFGAGFYHFGKAKTDAIDYYNPALVQRHDGLWLITRRSTAHARYDYGMNDLMAFKLDEQNRPQYGMKVTIAAAERDEHFEDPRVITWRGRQWLSACNFIIHRNGDWTGAHQVLLQIDNDWVTLQRHDPEYGHNGNRTRRNRGNEKNWLWFVHDGALHMIYTTRPHVVTRWDDQIRLVDEWRTDLCHPEWEHGEPRGGSAPVRVGNEYFSFFHSSTPWKDGKRRYHCGAYAFEARPPFRITRMTTKPLLSGSIKDPWAKTKPLVVFPCAAVQSAISNQQSAMTWLVSLGVNDLVSAWVRIPHARLLKKLDHGLVEMERVKSKMEVMFA